MLSIKNIKKQYKTGDLIQTALNDVSLTLRDNEFVAILGPSGSGKTTLLNIIGGLDRYDSGDLIINGISTVKYKSRDWDSYRNHTIGFVFQSYNLIPHQSILANVELALTISGVSRSERKKRAKEALNKVGLGDQIHKKPNQMSGGQMQRVAIARALVNNPRVLLADEPTGALDTETGIQVMELLKEVAKDRLVVMVTHNPELAEQYANRIVKLRDGKIIEDSNPITDTLDEKEAVHKNMGKARMTFFTSLSLSFNNLKTKKGRTFLTSFAGSIGIIGIALILALSTGVNQYISDIQKDTMTSYPITINAQTFDMSSMMEIPETKKKEYEESEETEDRTEIFADYTEMEVKQKLTTSITENDLTAFKKYLDDENSEIAAYIGDNGVVYTYDVGFDVWSYDKNDNLVKSDDTPDKNSSNSNGSLGSNANSNAMMGSNMMQQRMATALLGTSNSGAQNFQELMPGTHSMVSDIITDSYDCIYGTWPQTYSDVVLILTQQNEIPSEALYQLGLITEDQYAEISKQIEAGEEASDITFKYDDACGQTFYMVPACDNYIENEDGSFMYVGDNSFYRDQILEKALELHICGVIRPKKDAKNATLYQSVGYTAGLTDYIITHSNESAIVKAQEENPDVNVLNLMRFDAADDEQKCQDAIDYIKEMNVSDKASLYTMILFQESSKAQQNAESQDTELPGTDVETNPANMPNSTGAMNGISGTPSMGMMAGPMDENTMALALDQWLTNTPDEEILLAFYEQYIAGGSYEDNMKAFGKVSYDAPYSISIYTDSFDNKNAISDCITRYNKTVDEDSKITYTDYVAMLTSSISSIIDAISYVLIAFVAVSLFVSCIMIGIITHISVLERTKEIGILRALGASKRNISQVFNAETFIIGLCSGLLGVIISMVLTIPINAIIASLVGDTTVRAFLPIGYGAILVLISMIITVIGGLLPAKKAAKKDPVIALRTE